MLYLAFLVLAFPLVLTVWNFFELIYCLIKKKEKKYCKILELVAMCAGVIYLGIYLDLADVIFASWDVQLYNSEKHFMISPSALPTVIVVSLAALAGYILIRFIPAEKQPPLVSAAGISAVYLGIGLCALWCVQTYEDIILLILPLNCIVIFIKTVFMLVCEKSAMLKNGLSATKYTKLPKLLDRAVNLPWIALLLTVPLLGGIIVVLSFFGQAPDSVIKAWTETADWTMSQKIAPPNIAYDEHYLCTVAAGGHRKVVHPLRIGIRHGHRVVVNRQLCVANAFEQVLEQKVPALHKAVRKIYDSTGYPIAKHIRSQYTADAVYVLMKPLEWFFTLVLYSVDAKPENRIAVQYPHAPLPEEFGNI